MTHLKNLGLAAVVVAIVAALVGVASASASEFHIEGTTGPFELRAEQVAEENHVFTIEGGLTTKCKKATFTGSAANNTEPTQTVTPAYGECTAFGLSVTINMSGCDYQFANPANGQVSIVGCGATPATIVTGTCEIQIANQGPKSTVSYTNRGTSPKTIELTANVSSLKYNKTKDGFLCPLSGTGEREDGTYTGDTIARGFEGEAQKGIFVE